MSSAKNIHKMAFLTATEAKRRFCSLVDEVKQSHEPVHIVGKRSSAVLISEGDWRAIQETLHLTLIPGMSQSIREGLDTPAEECDEDIDW
jgi:prevent-host-death family protein